MYYIFTIQIKYYTIRNKLQRISIELYRYTYFTFNIFSLSEYILYSLETWLIKSNKINGSLFDISKSYSVNDEWFNDSKKYSKLCSIFLSSFKKKKFFLTLKNLVKLFVKKKSLIMNHPKSIPSDSIKY